MLKKLKKKLEEILSKKRDTLDDDEIDDAKEKLDDEGTQGFRKNAELLVDMVDDVMHKRFKASPETMMAIVAAIIYFIWVLDLVPDFIPVAGYVDDGIVIATTIKSCMDDVRRYKKWRTKQDGWLKDNPISRMAELIKEKLRAFKEGWDEE